MYFEVFCLNTADLIYKDCILIDSKTMEKLEDAKTAILNAFEYINAFPSKQTSLKKGKKS